MNILQKTIVSIIALLSSLLLAEKSPMEWTSINTNLIEKWKKDFNAPKGVYVNAKAKSVHFLMETTGIGTNDTIEFFAIGPLSDRSYESFGVSVANPSDIAKAIESIGVPQGVAVNQTEARFWPQGEKIKLQMAKYDGKLSKPQPFSNFLRDTAAKEYGEILNQNLVWTGGSRDSKNELYAGTNMPCAVMALYSLDQSPILLNGVFDQSATYGRFFAASKSEAGELLEVILSWDGKKTVHDRTVNVSSQNTANIVKALHADAKAGYDIFLKVVFDKDVTIGEAKKIASVFDMIDGNGIKLNGAAKNNFFVKAFLPDEKWNNRENRIFQPFEIHLEEDGTKKFIFIEEDWSGDGMDPILKPRETRFEKWSEIPALIKRTGKQGEKIFVAFIYAPSTAKVSDITPLTSLMPRINTFYIFSK